MYSFQALWGINIDLLEEIAVEQKVRNHFNLIIIDDLGPNPAVLRDQMGYKD